MSWCLRFDSKLYVVIFVNLSMDTSDHGINSTLVTTIYINWKNDSKWAGSRLIMNKTYPNIANILPIESSFINVKNPGIWLPTNPKGWGTHPYLVKHSSIHGISGILNIIRIFVVGCNWCCVDIEFR